jgi:hypothetical protein
MENKKIITDINDIDLNDTVGDGEEVEYGKYTDLETLILTLYDIECEFNYVNKRNCKLFFYYIHSIYFDKLWKYNDDIPLSEILTKLFKRFINNYPSDFHNEDVELFQECWNDIVSGKFEINDFDKYINSLSIKNFHKEYIIYQDDFYSINNDNNKTIIKKNGIVI